jgi:hypothetical protein
MMPKDRKKNHQVYFGVKFIITYNTFIQQNNSADAYLETEIVKEKCVSMLEEALSQGTCRPRSARDNFESLSEVSPVIILNKISRPMFSELHFIHYAVNNVSKI